MSLAQKLMGIVLALGLIYFSKGLGMFVYTMTETSFGPGGGSTLYPPFVLKPPVILPDQAAQCVGVTVGKWVGCYLP